MSSLTTVTIILSTLTTISQSCNYVGSAKFINTRDEYDEEDNRSPMPIGVCTTDKNGTDIESEMFVCTPWGPYLFKFDVADCDATQGAPTIYAYAYGDYVCDSTQPCKVFKVRTNAGCTPTPDIYHEFATVADQCWLERNSDRDDNGTLVSVEYRTNYAQCLDNGNRAFYRSYNDLNCGAVNGSPNLTINATDGTCVEIPDRNGPTESYFNLIECGPRTPAATPECSYIVGAVWNETEMCHNNQANNYTQCNKARDESVAVPMGFDVCTNELRCGAYSSELFFCSPDLNMAFVAEWRMRERPTQCDTKPDSIAVIHSHTDFECSPSGVSCPHLNFRQSKFEDSIGNRTCSYSDNYSEMRIVTDTCFAMGGGTGAKSQCPNGNLLYYGYANLSACQNNETALMTIPFSNDECYDFDKQFGTAQNGVGNWSFWQAIQCEGTSSSNNQRPDCNFVENAVTYDEYGQKQDGDDDGMRVPIGVCVSHKNESESSSQMYICPPWGGVAKAMWNDTDCSAGSGTQVKVESANYTDYECDSTDTCDYIIVRLNDAENVTGAGCSHTPTRWREKIFIQGCGNNYKVDRGGDGNSANNSVNSNDCDRGQATKSELKSVHFACDSTSGTNTVTYSIYEQGLDCPLTYDMQIVTSDGECAFFGDGAPQYVNVTHCGPQTPVTPPNQCSYIVNPTYNSSELGYEEREGAFPLSPDICLMNSDAEQVYSSMYVCDYASQLAFMAMWNNSQDCTGKPTFIERITGREMVCASADVSHCDYVHVMTSSISNDSECGVGERIEESARLLNQCWPNKEGDSDMSWIADCAGDQVTIEKFQVTDCSVTSEPQIVVNDGECTTGLGDTDGTDQTYFNVLFCSNPSAPDTTQAATTTTESQTTSTQGQTSTTTQGEISTTASGTTEAVSTVVSSTESGSTIEGSTTEAVSTTHITVAETTGTTTDSTTESETSTTESGSSTTESTAEYVAPTVAPTAFCERDPNGVEFSYNIAEATCDFCVCTVDEINNDGSTANDFVSEIIEQVCKDLIVDVVEPYFGDAFLDFCQELTCTFAEVRRHTGITETGRPFSCDCDGFYCPDPQSANGNMVGMSVFVAVMLFVIVFY